MRMIKRWTAVLICLGAFLGEARGLNLTPFEVVLDRDGPPQKHYYFQDTDKRLGFRIDAKTTVSGSNEAAVFRFTNCERSVMRLLRSPSVPDVSFAGDGLKAYEMVARTLLPGGISKLQLTELKPDAIAINGWTSLQFVFTYEWAGSSYERTITFLNFSATEQFVCDISSPMDTYEGVYARGYRILNSIFELPLARETGPT